MAEEKVITVNDINYIVSSDGHVYSMHDSASSSYHQEIKQRQNEDGYMVITTGKTGNRKTESVHRMVATAFIPNPDNLPEVNHKDCDRTNNSVDNLEWCTHFDNVQYAIKMGNHICTRNLNGSNNPNFGNDTLKKKYAANPELAKQNNSRPGCQNGRARAVKLINSDTNDEFLFGYLREASKYLINNGFTRATDVDAVLNRISMAAKTGATIYKRFKVEFIN
jgi:hypothetical protein